MILSQTDYILFSQYDGVLCPNCQSTDIDELEPAWVEGDIRHQALTCANCDLAWDNLTKHLGYKVIEG